MKGPMTRLLSVGMSVGFLGMMLARTSVGWWLILILAVGATLCAGAIYLLRFESEIARKVYGNSFGRPVLDVICSITGEQKPGGVREAADRSRSGPSTGEEDAESPPTYAVLRSDSDFEIAGERLKNEVLGHDHAIDTILDDLRRGVIVRIKRPESGATLLGSYLLYGPTGIGKRMLAVAIGRMFYPQGEILQLDGREYMDPGSGLADLFGSGGSPGRLLEAVKRQPLQTVIFEHIDSCHPEILARLAPILVHGGCVDPSSGGTVSFEHCVFFFLSSKLGSTLESITKSWSAGDEWMSQAVAMLGSSQKLDASLLETLHAVVPIHPLEPIARAEVIVRLMSAECDRYRVQLRQVDPEVVAEQVGHVGGERGFEGVHARIKSVLREDLARAVEVSMPVLTVRRKAGES